MLTLALSLCLLVLQPDDGPVATQQVIPPPSEAALAEARRTAEDQKVKAAEQRKKDQEALNETLLNWAAPAPTKADPGKDLTFDEALAADYTKRNPPAQDPVAAANAAAIARAEQSGKDVNTPGAWPDDGKMRCKPTDSGFVCGNSDKALEEGSPSRKALDDLLTKPN